MGGLQKRDRFWCASYLWTCWCQRDVKTSPIMVEKCPKNPEETRLESRWGGLRKSSLLGPQHKFLSRPLLDTSGLKDRTLENDFKEWEVDPGRSLGFFVPCFFGVLFFGSDSEVLSLQQKAFKEMHLNRNLHFWIQHVDFLLPTPPGPLDLRNECQSESMRRVQVVIDFHASQSTGIFSGSGDRWYRDCLINPQTKARTIPGITI